MKKTYPDWLSNLSYKAGYYLTKGLIFIVLGLIIYGMFLLASSSVTIKIIVHLVIAVLGVLVGTFVKIEGINKGKLLLIAIVSISYAIVEIIVLLSLPWPLATALTITFISTMVAMYATKNRFPGEKTVQVISKILFYVFNLSLAGYLFYHLFLK